MKKTRFIPICLFTVSVAAFFSACGKNGDAPSTSPLTFEIPAGFPADVTVFADNPLTKEGLELGRKLFYEGKLSKDGNFPCASCHQQFAAFATFDHPFSHGFNNSFTTRNAPGLFNLAWQKEFHWDGGITHLELQPLAPISAPNEMAEDIGNVINKLKQDPAYPPKFKAAFGTEEINSQRMLKAIAQFVGSLVSANSKYDRVKKGTEAFTPVEQQGYVLFKANCASCHTEPLFTDNSYRNNGMDVNPYLNDYGRMRITRKSADSLKFKVPSLRNVELTFPYGHDGRFNTLDKMIGHYMNSVQQSATLDPLLKNGIPLTIGEKDAIISFLKTLSDQSFLKDPRFSMPE